jgi:hypothetical protein
MPMRLQCFRIVIGGQDDAHAGLFKAEAEAARASEEIGREKLAGVLPAGPIAELEERLLGGAVISVRLESYEGAANKFDPHLALSNRRHHHSSGAV